MRVTVAKRTCNISNADKRYYLLRFVLQKEVDTYDCRLISEHNLARMNISAGNHVSSNRVTFANIVEDITMVRCCWLILFIQVNVISWSSVPITERREKGILIQLAMNI